MASGALPGLDVPGVVTPADFRGPCRGQGQARSERGTPGMPPPAVLLPSVTGGRHIREWIVEAIETLPEADPQAAWTHRTHLGDVLQLFIRSWKNPRPDVALDRLDLESTMTESAPFVVAITLDP
jgi:hypothetical protein